MGRDSVEEAVEVGMDGRRSEDCEDLLRVERGAVLKNCVKRLFIRGKVVRFGGEGCAKSIFSLMTSGRSEK